MALSILPTSMRAVVFVILSAFALNVTKPQVALSQNANSQRNKCTISENLKAAKTVSGTYTEEAEKKNIEGTVVLCVTVDGNGRVTDVEALSGPLELLQPSIDAAKQWHFEPPPKAPTATKIEMGYSLSKPCPDGWKGMDVGEVTAAIGKGYTLDGEQGGALKIVGELYQPLPPYPEKARARGVEVSFTCPLL